MLMQKCTTEKIDIVYYDNINDILIVQLKIYYGCLCDSCLDVGGLVRPLTMSPEVFCCSGG